MKSLNSQGISILFASTQRLLFYFLISALALACSDDNKSPSLCLLNKSLTTYADGSTEEWNMTYNSSNQLIQYVSNFTSTNGTSTYSFVNTFDLNGNIIKEVYDDGHVDYTYNSNKQVVREDYFDGTAKTGTIESEYNNAGQIIKRQHYTITGRDVPVADYYSLVEYETTTTKNVKTITRYNQDGSLNMTIDYQYDNKNNPFSTKGLTALFAHGENNITKETGTEGATITVHNYSYEYNTQGFPSTMTYTSSIGTTNYTEVYIYNCK